MKFSILANRKMTIANILEIANDREKWGEIWVTSRKYIGKLGSCSIQSFWDHLVDLRLF